MNNITSKDIREMHPSDAPLEAIADRLEELERQLYDARLHEKELSRYLFTDPHHLEIRMSIGNVRWMRSIWGGCIEQNVNPETVIKQEAEAMFKQLWEMHKGEQIV